LPLQKHIFGKRCLDTMFLKNVSSFFFKIKGGSRHISCQANYTLLDYIVSGACVGSAGLRRFTEE